jgi:tetratricopeptide (TPR) repeat protein
MRGIGRVWRARSERKADAQLRALQGRAGWLLKEGRLGEAEALIAEGVRLSGDIFGADSRRALAWRVGRANVLQRRRRFKEAEAELSDVLAKYEQSSESAQEVDAARARLVLVRTYLRGSRLTAAEEECRALLQIEGPIVPAEVRWRAQDLLALSLANQGRHAESSAAFDATAADAPQDSAWQLKARCERAQQWVYLGRLEEAAAECDAVERAAVALGTAQGLALRLMARSNRIMALMGMDRLGEAEEQAREAFASAVRRGPDYARLAFVLQLRLCELHNARGEHEEALRFSERALSGLADHAEMGSDAGTVHIVAAAALLGLGRASKAAERARAALDSYRSALTPIHYRTLVAEALLGQCLAAGGHQAEAETLLQTNTASWRQYFGENHPRTQSAQAALKATLLQRGADATP